MLEILKYIFSSPWIFTGTVMLIYVIGDIMQNIVVIICKTVIGAKGIKYFDRTDIRTNDTSEMWKDGQMNDYIEARVKEVAQYIIDTDATVREAAKKFGVGRNTIYLDITERLKEINPVMQAEISLILKSHKSEMHIRGGISTKSKFRGGQSLW